MRESTVSFCGEMNCPEAVLVGNAVFVTNNAAYSKDGDPGNDGPRSHAAYDGAYAIPKAAWEAHIKLFQRQRMQETVGQAAGAIAGHAILTMAAEGTFDDDRRGMVHDITAHFDLADLAAIDAAFAEGGVWNNLTEGGAVVAPSQMIRS